jgi:hypothetical protein
MARARRVRVLICEGPYEWVEKTTENEGRYVNGKRVLSVSRPTNPYPFTEPIILEPAPIPVPDMVITEYLTEMEVI